MPTAAFFDLDRTLLDMNSSTLWAKHELRNGGISIRQFGRVGVEDCLDDGAVGRILGGGFALIQTRHHYLNNNNNNPTISSSRRQTEEG